MQAKQHTVPVIIEDGEARKLQPIPLDQRTIDEGFLQRLLFDHPEMIPIEEIEPICADVIPLARELRTPAGPLDILFVNANGFLTIVETKLWRNPEARRSVVGQIIDYAKHVARWSYTDLEAQVRNAPVSALDSNQTLADLVSAEIEDFDERQFVTNVERNLRLGHFLLLIVGDGVHEGVEQMAEFLNQTPQLGFQLALVEMSLFRLSPNDESAFFVTPRVVARTKEITRAIVRIEIVDGKAQTDVRIPDEAGETVDGTLTQEEFLRGVEEHDGKDARKFMEWVFDEAKQRGIEPYWGTAGFGLWYAPDGDNWFNLAQFGRKLTVPYVSIRHVVMMCKKVGIDPQIGTDYIDELVRLLGNAERISFGKGGQDQALRLKNGKRPRIAEFMRIRDGWIAALDRTIDRLNQAFADR